MRIVEIEIHKYRSILRSERVRLGSTTTLVGGNNEGKSNILRALVVAMTALTRERGSSLFDDDIDSIRLRRFRDLDLYDWIRDFPIPLQITEPDGQSKVLLKFELDSVEIEEFFNDTGSRINGDIPLEVAFSRDRRPLVRVRKKGPGRGHLEKKRPQIAAFLAKRISFQHIPTIRTARASEEIIQNLIERELRVLDDSPEFVRALRKITELQRPILDRLGKGIQETLATFLPTVKGVDVSIPPDARLRAIARAPFVLVDDGTPTPLAEKGDGVQSLAALALMRLASASKTTAAGKEKNLVIAIEEPESHLHPAAARFLRSVLAELSQRHQVVISTHSPLFVDRQDPGNNIIVDRGRARVARSIRDIRDKLGIVPADNLVDAEIVLLVEGETDAQILKAVFSHRSPRLRRALADSRLGIQPLRGAANLTFYADMIQNTWFGEVRAFVDFDKAGRDAADAAVRATVLRSTDISYARMPSPSRESSSRTCWILQSIPTG